MTPKSDNNTTPDNGSKSGSNRDDKMIPGHYGCIFPGSFNPFTIGHKDIAERAAEMFGSVLIAVGYNESKAAEGDIESRVKDISDVFEGDSRFGVTAYTGLTVNLMKELDIRVIIRGLRGITDFEYEKGLADINNMIAGVETVFLLTRPGLGAISSSMIRELEHNGYDASRWVASKS